MCIVRMASRWFVFKISTNYTFTLLLPHINKRKNYFQIDESDILFLSRSLSQIWWRMKQKDKKNLQLTAFFWKVGPFLGVYLRNRERQTLKNQRNPNPKHWRRFPSAFDLFTVIMSRRFSQIMSLPFVNETLILSSYKRWDCIKDSTIIRLVYWSGEKYIGN